MKYYIKTFGCQMNESDSERIAGFLETHRIKPTKDINQANLVIFNTCGVRQSAENRVYGLVHNLRKSNPKITIILTGCLADRKDVQRRLEDKVDLFCNINNFPEKLKPLLVRHPERSSDSYRNVVEGSTKKYNQKTQKADSSATFPRQGRGHSAQNDGSYLDIIPKYINNNKVYVPIMTGCNNFCSYCVVPYARGREISRPVEDIIKEIKSLTKNDCKEITLLGQNVNSYNYEFKNSKLGNLKLIKNLKLKIKNSVTVDFPKLLDYLAKSNPQIRFKFLTSHPKDFSNELIKVIAKNKNISREIHLPVQAGSDKILKAMNRPYTQKYYLNLIKKIKKIIPEAEFTTDIIVGFPGEAKKDFSESIKVFKTVSYNEAYINKYSPRPDTAAWKMKETVDLPEKKRREKVLRELIRYGRK
ncbi:MAG: MiaB/RimO family radical SAM methylthiotransferase [Parcubacteria group bacterium]